MKKYFVFVLFLVAFVLIEKFLSNDFIEMDSRFLSFIVDLNKDELRFFLKNADGEFYQNFRNLNDDLKNQNKEMVFATNGGMFMQNFMPLGLYVENGKPMTPINKKNGKTNFYIKPNGIFYLTKDKKASIKTTSDFKFNKSILYATQSGPMLLINGKINPEFRNNSINLNIRNGVGILPDNKVLFALTKMPMNFYDFANYFKEMKCKEALFLDGGISEFYYPEKGFTESLQSFGIIIAVVKEIN